eukprot:CAMPEP_0113471496 /NCGR_PEP_ID=MMETSP0014_2-20120614/17006_1 /TAXON_ID=2857 /ORGANISM="Nitzschia sp." /LENGTH=395 /DNA_ID=CAMNT_0000364129 /DNA_START=107 /DNA_END=1290 /DNA_ORIENTATION=+ /assembly_acc=CAM_ASM_000159
MIATATTSTSTAVTKKRTTVPLALLLLIMMMMMTAVVVVVDAQVDEERSLCEFCNGGLPASSEDVVVSQRDDEEGVDLMVTCKDIFVFNLAVGMTEDQCDLSRATLLETCGCETPEPEEGSSAAGIAESFFDMNVFCTACSDGTPTTSNVAVGGKTCGQWDAEGRSSLLSVSECLSLQTATSVAPDDPCQCGTGGGGGPGPGPGPSPATAAPTLAPGTTAAPTFAPVVTPAPTVTPPFGCPSPTDVQYTITQTLRDPTGLEDSDGTFATINDLGASSTSRVKTECLAALSGSTLYLLSFDNDSSTSDVFLDDNLVDFSLYVVSDATLPGGQSVSFTESYLQTNFFDLVPDVGGTGTGEPVYCFALFDENGISCAECQYYGAAGKNRIQSPDINNV